MTIQEQRKDVENAILRLQSIIEKASSDKIILTNAFNELGKGEDMLKGRTILAEETRRIMCNISK
jgi:hypothetical protein